MDKIILVAHPTLSLSAEDTSRRQQNPTGDPHLSSPFSCKHGPRRHRRAPGAPSPSPRWVHVARWPHAPGKSPVCCWSCASDGSSLVMRVSDWGTVGRARSFREHRACRQTRGSVKKPVDKSRMSKAESVQLNLLGCQVCETEY